MMRTPPRAVARHAGALFAATVLAMGGGCQGRVTSDGQVAVEVTPSSTRLAPLGTQPFAATVTGSSVSKVAWTVQEGGGGAVTSGGLYTAPGVTGTFHVVASSVADSSKSGSATISVVDAAPLTVSPNPASVAVGAAQQFTVAPAGTVVDWSVVQAVAAATAPTFPLRVAPSGRWLEDQNGKPWRIKADAAWLLSSMASPAQVDSYLANRTAKGFNAFYLMAMVHPTGYGPTDAYHGNTANTYDYAGNPAFTTPNNFATPGAAYWSNLDSIIAKAAAAGVAVCLFPNYLGYAGLEQGWETVVAAMSGVQATAWGTWIGNRYKDASNVIWMAAGDHHPSGTALTNVNLITAAIKAAGATQPWGAEFNGHNDVPSIDDADVTGVDMDSFYGYGPNGLYNTFWDADRAYLHGARPVWVQESGYEYEDNTGQRGGQNSQWYCRRSHLWSVLAGATAGYGFGTMNVYLMSWGTPGNSLDSPGSIQTGYAHGLLASLPWWDLRPSGIGTGKAGKTLITAGAGTWGQNAVDTVTSAVTSDGRWLLAYLPGTNNGTATASITVDMTSMGGATRARWWNPVTGSYSAIGTGYANSGTQAFATPGSNGAGNDWVLVLDVPGASLCGTIDATGRYTAPATMPVGVDCHVLATLRSNPAVTASSLVTVH